MATNKNALIRYQALDRCLGDRHKRYYMQDLIDACNRALYDYNGSGGVQRRQIFDDLRFIESDSGYGLQIDKIRDYHKKYYRYANPGDSINNRPFTQDEINTVSNAVMLLRRFRGVPQFDWLDNMAEHLDATTKYGFDALEVVSFQNNPYLTGMDKWYQPLFHCIIARHAVEIKYKPFDKPERTQIVSPYLLKQYNNRWFLIARNDGAAGFSTLAIDRIRGVRETDRPCEPLDEDFSFDEYFGEVVGVSVNEQAPVEKVVLHVTKEQIPYIITKPLHETQGNNPTRLENGKWEVTFKVKDNYELRSLLLSFGPEIEVVAPASLREAMRQSALRLAEIYG